MFPIAQTDEETVRDLGNMFGRSVVAKGRRLKGIAKDDATDESIHWIAVSIQIILTFPANAWQEEHSCLYSRRGWRRAQHSEKVLMCGVRKRAFECNVLLGWKGATRRSEVKLCFSSRADM